MLEYHSSEVSRLFLVFIILHKLVQVYILSVQAQETGIPFVLLLNRFVGLKQRQREVLQVVEGTSVGDVFGICSEQVVVLANQLPHIALELHSVQSLTSEYRPGDHLVELIKCREEAILLAPNQILVLISHADKVHCVELRE